MVEVVEVKTKKQQKEFIEFPVRMYKNNPSFVPPLYMDEIKIFRPDYVYYEQSEAVYYLAYRDGKVVGRISGILQRAANEKYNEKAIRFTRFDTIDDKEVSKALFDAVENWGRSKGMEIIRGPLGFSDFEREGMLIEGFDEPETFEEQYNDPYYPEHMDALGYEKEIDWLESRLTAPKERDQKLERLSEIVMQRNKFHFAKAKSIDEFIRRYGDSFFTCVDESYEKIYGTVPFTEGMKQMMYDNFRAVEKLDFVSVLVNENDEPVALGLCFPSLSKAVKKSGGHLTPACILRILHARNHSKEIDLGLIGIVPKYLQSGAAVCIVAEMLKGMVKRGVTYAETNLNMETNMDIRNMWKRFNGREHKRRRSYIKKL